MLTFEYDSTNKCLEVFFDEEGGQALSFLVANALKYKDHLHLKTEAWGGGELNEEQQDTLAELINHVKLIPV